MLSTGGTQGSQGKEAHLLGINNTLMEVVLWLRASVHPLSRGFIKGLLHAEHGAGEWP